MDIWRSLTDYWWVAARGLGVAVPFFLVGRLQRSPVRRLSVGLAASVYMVAITLAAVVSDYSGAILTFLLLLALVAFNIGRYISLTSRVDRIFLVAAFVAVAAEPITDKSFGLALGGQLRITYNTLLAETVFDLSPAWMRSDSVGLANYVSAPSILSQIGMSVLATTVVFVVAVLISQRSAAVEVRYQWATILSLGAAFLVLPNDPLLLAVVVLAAYLGGRCRAANLGFSFDWLFRTPVAWRWFLLWAVIAAYVLLYQSIFASAAVARFGGGPVGSSPTNLFAVCLGIGLLSLVVGMLFRELFSAYPLNAPKAFGVLQICIGVLGILGVAAEISRTGVAIVSSRDSLLLGLALIYAVPGTLVGIALVAELSWARVAGIGVSVIDLVVMPLRPFPIGLLVGGLGIVVLWFKRGSRNVNRDVKADALPGNSSGRLR